MSAQVMVQRHQPDPAVQQLDEGFFLLRREFGDHIVAHDHVVVLLQARLEQAGRLGQRGFRVLHVAQRVEHREERLLLEVVAAVGQEDADLLRRRLARPQPLR